MKTLFLCFVEAAKSACQFAWLAKIPASTALFPRRHCSDLLKGSYLCLLNLALTIATVGRLVCCNMYQRTELSYKVGRRTPSLLRESHGKGEVTSPAGQRSRFSAKTS